MVDDFNKPLGQKEEKPSKQETGAGDAGKWSGRAGLMLGLIALGLIGWQYFKAPDKVPTEPAGEQIAKVEPAQKPDPDKAPAVENDEEVDEPVLGETGLTELEPNGSIAVPKLRPPEVKPQEIGLAHLPDPDLIEKGATGVIPKRGSDGRRPMDVYAREPDTTGNFGIARVVLIVGGIGISQTSSQAAIRDLPSAVTLAFAPYGNSLQRWMQTARKKGHELLLQVPMEPFGYPDNSPGAQTLVSSVSPEENQVNLHWLLSRTSNYVGVMNFQGAKLLSEPGPLRPIFDELSERGLLFVDDGTAGNSKSSDVANQSILAHTTAHVQLDQVRTRRDIAEKLDFLVTQAKRTGLAIGVSNGFSETIEMLAEFTKKANELGIEITPVSAIVEDPERDR
ncbi:MAG: divergent polysaccharide deacetylase family protein [Salaquimonas sp.]